jgi:hypothetical protein
MIRRLRDWWNPPQAPLRRAGPLHDRKTEGWHADGNGFIWNATEWRWMGPVVDLAAELRDHPARTLNGFEEWIG